MQTRNRNTVALSNEGRSIVEAARAKKGWTQLCWSDFASVSVTTVKRLLRGKFVDRDSFDTLLSVLEVTIQDDHIIKKIELHKTILLAAEEVEPSTSALQPGVFMTGTFTKDKRPQIERALRHLQRLLIGCKVNFRDEQGVVTVSGEFSEQKRVHIEATISELEELFTSLEVTW
jgi:transcriptional regulator with XRE-family HTH domain